MVPWPLRMQRVHTNGQNDASSKYKTIQFWFRLSDWFRDHYTWKGWVNVKASLPDLFAGNREIKMQSTVQPIQLQYTEPQPPHCQR